MSIPRPERISDLFRQLEAINYRKLREDLAAAVKRERDCGTNLADGYSSGGGGSGSSGHGDPTVSALLSREQARRDTLRDCTHTAADNVQKAVTALHRAEEALHSISVAVGNQPITPTGCDLCTEAGLKDKPWHHAKSSVGGKLDRSLYLCTAHYQLIHRTGQEPSTEQTLHWDRTGSWRIRESA